ncbi:hypothetical protein MTO96_018203 [Rhipicephalus appendiculatus]
MLGDSKTAVITFYGTFVPKANGRTRVHPALRDVWRRPLDRRPQLSTAPEAKLGIGPNTRKGSRRPRCKKHHKKRTIFIGAADHGGLNPKSKRCSSAITNSQDWNIEPLCHAQNPRRDPGPERDPGQASNQPTAARNYHPHPRPIKAIQSPGQFQASSQLNNR